MWILTTPEGANLPAAASLADFPLLVRLHKDFFDFSMAAPGGADLRFSTNAGVPLAYQIDHWDAAHGVAGIWVRIPRIEGNSQQELKLHWGNADAKGESSGKAVFNPSNGYLSVWHLGDELQDEVGTLQNTDTGTTRAPGTIGQARHFPGQKGIFGGDKIPNYPAGASSHTSEAWFRAERSNVTILGWGNEGGGRGSKVRMQFRSPPHMHVDSDFSDVDAKSQLPLGQWIHVAHTYDREDGKIYINGKLDGAANPLLNIKSPARLWIGGWYHHYDFVGDIDEVRISQVARSADWLKLQYENQTQLQTLVGPVVQPGREFSVSTAELTLAEGQTIAVAEGQSIAITAKAGGARQVFWSLLRDGQETLVATDRFTYTFAAGRVTQDTSLVLRCKAIYAGEVKTKDIPISIQEAIPEPVVAMHAPATWDGRETIEVVAQIANLGQLQAKAADKLNYAWTVSGIATIQQIVPGKLILKRAQNSGPMTVKVAVDNGGEKTIGSATIAVKEPTKDAWVERVADTSEQPEDNQFYARDSKNEAALYYNGTLQEAADSVFVRVYADSKLFESASDRLPADKSYALAVKLKPGLVKYRTEFGTKTGNRESILHTAANLICGDAYLIDGQSNAEATDVGPDDPTFTSDWIRSYGSTAGDPAGARLARWANAVVRDRNGGKAQIGYWGMELARQLVEDQKLPICIINGAVGGTRIDQHQRNPADPTDVASIYGRLLWRVRQAKLTHGIRGVLWHQGENDQGADGPSGGYGWETYRQYFVDLAASWKEDYPNIQHYYVFQIWPKACSMGIGGSDNKLREVQRTLPAYFSNLSVMSTLGIKPPGGCHYPVDGYAEFARLIGPLVQRNQYHKMSGKPVTAPNLRRPFYTSDQHDEVVLEFDQHVVWAGALSDQFYFDGQAKQVAAGSANGNQITLKLKSPSQAGSVTYLDSASWSPDNLLYGQNGIAALTFCDVPILPQKPGP